MRKIVLSVLLLFTCYNLKAQYYFTGNVDTEQWNNSVYLSVVEDYRKISGIYAEQIICKIDTDSYGYFEFSGNQLEDENRIYRIHVDNCMSDEQNSNHFDGHCNNSKEVLFIAKNNDSIALPFSFENQMFCNIKSNNPKATAFVRIDSLREDMKFAFGEFRSEANRKLNSKKWFKTLQDFGKNLNEPLAELYIYSFLSDRSTNLHDFYLEDLKSNPYYDELLARLETRYPDSPYTKQYKSELTSDKFINSEHNESSFKWWFVLIPIFILSLLANVYFGLKIKNNNSQKIQDQKEQLTTQEQKVLELLLLNNSNKDIAEGLFVSVSTVKSHTNNIYKKLNVNSRDEIKALFNR